MTSPFDRLLKFQTITERALRVSFLCLQPLFEFLPGPVTILLTERISVPALLMALAHIDPQLFILLAEIIDDREKVRR